MLIRFTVENFLSLRDEVEFSMVAGLPRKHPQHVIRREHGGYSRLLKAGIIYGANAAGKSNLVLAMAFAKRLIVGGTRIKERIPVLPFQLDADSMKRPTKFLFEICCGDKTYQFGFEIDSRTVRSEWLTQIQKRSNVKLYDRVTDNEGHTSVDLGKLDYNDLYPQSFMNHVAKGTRANQLFLTNTLENGVDYFKELYDWFDDKLRLIFPNPRSAGVETATMSESEFEKGSREIIGLFDLGIDNVVLEDLDSPLPHSVQENFLEAHREDQEDIAIQFPSENLYVFVSADNQIRARQFKTIHRIEHEDRDVVFELSQESDGTQRLFELSSALIGLLGGAGDKVYVIDELDRRLHPHMTKNIVDIFLTNSVERPSQLIVTTHESSLLDLELVRRDEVWFIEKDNSGCSRVYSLEEFAPRYDMEIEKGYLRGRFGAIPIIPSFNTIDWAN